MRNRSGLALLATCALMASSACEFLVGIEDRSVASPATEPEQALEAGGSSEPSREAGPEAAAKAGIGDAAIEGNDDATTTQDPVDPACFGALKHLEAESSTASDTLLRPVANGFAAYMLLGRLVVGDRLTLGETSFSNFVPVEFVHPDGGKKLAITNFAETPNRLTAFIAVQGFESCTSCRRILRSKRTSVSETWGEPTPFNAVIPADAGIPPADFDPYPLADDSSFYFSSTRNGTRSSIFRAVVIGDFFSSLGALEGKDLNLASADQDSPAATPDELTLYFARTTPTLLTTGTKQIWVSQRKTTNIPFESPVRVAFDDPRTLAPTWNAQPSWISPDGCILYISADRLEENGHIENDRDLYRSVRCDCVGKTNW